MPPDAPVTRVIEPRRDLCPDCYRDFLWMLVSFRPAPDPLQLAECEGEGVLSLLKFQYPGMRV